jgi:hypothetical protein
MTAHRPNPILITLALSFAAIAAGAAALVIVTLLAVDAIG